MPRRAARSRAGAVASSALAVVLGCVLGGASAASASVMTPFMDVNFNSDIVGAAPSTGVSGSPISIPGALGGYDSDPFPVSDPGYKSPPTASCGTILVNDAGSLTKAAVMTTNPANGELGALFIDTHFSQASQSLTLSFDLNVLAAPTNATAQVKTLNGSGSAGIFFGINTYADSAWAARFAVAPTSARGRVFAIRTPNNADHQSIIDYAEGTTYHLDLVSDYSTGLVSTYVNGVATGSKAFASGPLPGVPTTSEIFMHLNGESGFTNQLAIDNIVAAVPEPASLGLCAVGAVGLLRRRSRR